MFAKKFFHRVYNQSGQAILIIVLVMVVALTVGLSVATRTITSLRNSQDQSSSQKALSAAEAGVEQSIRNQASIGSSNNPQDLGNKASYSTTVTAVLGTKFLLNGNNQLSKDEGGFLWLGTPPWPSSNPGPWSGSISFYWGESGVACNNAALEIAVISGNSVATANVTKYALDPCTTRGNQFTTTTSTPPVVTASHSVSGISFHYSFTIPVSNGFLIKVLPAYSNSYVAVESTTALPKQGNIITSTGTSDTATRTVNVYAGYPEIPTELFPYNLFSP
jgi:hypothetical protein